MGTRRTRAELLSLERQGALDLILAYQKVYRRLSFRLKGITDRIAETDSPSLSWLHRQSHYQLLLAEIEREASAYLDSASQQIRSQQTQALLKGEADAHALTLSALGPAPPQAVAQVAAQFGGLPARAFERIVGSAADGKPLDRLLRSAAPTTVDLVKDALAYGVASGQNPRVIAREFKRAAGTPLARALMVSRTETIRAHREASLLTYRGNRDVVSGWVWVSSFDRRTCMACALQSGTEHSLSESLNSHPNCRCSVAPRTKSWADLGFKDIPDSRPPVKTGEERFNALPAEEQKARMGPAKYDAWRAGHIELADLVKQTQSSVWGHGSREASLREALAA